MPFCARCLGASIGHIGAFFLFLIGNLPSFITSIILVSALGVDWSLQQWFGIMSNNNRRLVTGILGGMGVGAIAWPTLTYGYYVIRAMI